LIFVILTIDLPRIFYLVQLVRQFPHGQLLAGLFILSVELFTAMQPSGVSRLVLLVRPHQRQIVGHDCDLE
jgi:hypothetical protein